MIVAYVSGHGFGHATRTGEVLRQVRALDPSVPITLVSSAPEALFRRAIPGPLFFRRLECDVGLVQRDALEIDEAATADRCAEFARDMPDLVDTEWRWLRHAGAKVVVGDVPSIAFQAAHEAGIQSLGIANFSWDWIYRHLGSRQPKLREAAARCAEHYSRAGLLLRLPFAGDMAVFPRIEDIPMVARVPRLARAEARRRLGLGVDTTLLFSFGGLGLRGFDPQVLAPYRGFRFLTSERVQHPPANLRSVSAAELESGGLGYEDLVAAVDIVVTKPGYGIVSDAIAAGVRMIYTDRGDFPEYPVIVREMKTWLACAYVRQHELRQGRLSDAIREVLAMQPPPPPDLSGGHVAAWRILETLARAA